MLKSFESRSRNIGYAEQQWRSFKRNRSHPRRGCTHHLVDAAVTSGLKTATPPSGTLSSYVATTSAGIGAKSATRRKSRSDVPVEALSVLGAPRLSTTSSMLTVRKSMLQRTILVVFGTVE